MLKTKKKFLQAKSLKSKKDKPTPTQLAGYRSAIAAIKHSISVHRFRVKAPTSITEKSFRLYISKVYQAINTRIATIEAYIKFQPPEMQFKYITIAHKFYSQLDHLERDLKALQHFRDSVAEYKPE